MLAVRLAGRAGEMVAVGEASSGTAAAVERLVRSATDRRALVAPLR